MAIQNTLDDVLVKCSQFDLMTERWVARKSTIYTTGADSHVTLVTVVDYTSIMKLFVISLLLGVAISARLDGNYLPPAKLSSGGHGGFLLAPKQTVSSHGGHSYRPVTTPVPILRYNNENHGDGNYAFEYETGNSIKHSETSHLKTLGNEQVNEVHGSYSFIAQDGLEYTVTYIADEHGFRAAGAHLPTPPPIPDIIQRSLLQNVAEKSPTKTPFSGYSQEKLKNQYVPPVKSAWSLPVNNRYLAPKRTAYSGYNY